MEKVKVSREVAKAIESLKSSLCTIGTFKLALEGEWNLGKRHGIIMRELTKEEALSAIFYGYEIEKTPEEIIKEKYDELSDYEPIDRACMDSFRFVLDTLGIKIEGVNA